MGGKSISDSNPQISQHLIAETMFCRPLCWATVCYLLSSKIYTDESQTCLLRLNFTTMIVLCIFKNTVYWIHFYKCHMYFASQLQTEPNVKLQEKKIYSTCLSMWKIQYGFAIFIKTVRTRTQWGTDQCELQCKAINIKEAALPPYTWTHQMFLAFLPSSGWSR